MADGHSGQSGRTVQNRAATGFGLVAVFVTTHPHSLAASLVLGLMWRVTSATLACLALYLVDGHIGRHGNLVRRLVRMASS